VQNRILLGDSHNPWRNLAVEELLFDTLPEGGRVFYLWQNAQTVVIGRNQNAWKECRTALLEEEGGRLARRNSGGGAVFHDLGNLNFTFILPRGEYDVTRQLNVIRRAVAEFGVETQFTGRNDLVLTATGAKFSGNAFKLTEKTALHHGTLMVNVDVDKLSRYLAPSPDKLKAKGVDSVRSRVCNLSEHGGITIPALTEALQRAFVAEYGSAENMTVSDLPADRLAALEKRNASWEYRMGSTLPFDATLEHRFGWGGVALELSLREGVVRTARVYSDAMDADLIARIPEKLTGVRYDSSSLAQAVASMNNPQTDELAEWILEHEL